ncbi:long-chain acyl-CoA synthetase [Georgenia satyanarayanai]|uniref:Long-chain acyl-CoA synthetase n=1 Tax=Georgenia satyanarayanai TaxID=860221 RepID=A0A2Y9AR21_9MICO|nr:AMP-dependent synthetase/ligase [Georgenia satyanarayanai]PYF96763.1 long-chain acyl-CoA synthetase [Georgenia satyanarayanai]SSA46506.1 long-chain acyl-CoA synthetase [Georgenia satyanarayanai]
MNVQRPEASTPGVGRLEPHMSLPWVLADRLARDPAGVIFERKSSLGTDFVPVSVQTFAEEVTAVAKGLIGLGVQAGDRVAIMAHTSYEWSLLDFAAWSAGAVPVPIYETSSAEQAEWIVSNSGARLVFAETRGMAALLQPLVQRLEHLEQVLVLDENAVETVIGHGAGVPTERVTERAEATDMSSLATIIYTSGTTGRPKGAELTHGNFVTLVVNGSDDPNFSGVVRGTDKRTLVFMPLAHVFARFVEVLCVYSGATMGHVPDAKNLVADLDAFKPTFLLAVPRVFEKVYNSADAKAGSGAKQRIFRWGAKVAITYSRALESDGGPSAALKAQRALADRLVYAKIRAAMGGNLDWAISGGGPLGERLGHFFRGIGVGVLEGYGLTEVGAPTTVNRPGLTKIGTVGPPYPGTRVAIAEDGQVLVKGDHVFRGYHDNPEATAQAFTEDGWFVTGDIGQLDSDGYLRITGRKKELIVTAGGKNVAPAVLEDRLRGHPLLSQVVVVGDGRPFIGALVTLDEDMLPGWLANHDLPAMNVEQAASDERVLAALDRAVTRANEAVSRAESIRKITVLTTDFTMENGYLTPSQKVKRAKVLEDFADEITAIYGA